MTTKLPRTLFVLLAPSLASTAYSQARLADDAAIGKVSDREGVALLKRVAGERWDLARQGSPLEPGVWVKTTARGPNALEILLRDGSRLVLGPGTIAGLASPADVRLQAGDLEVRPEKGSRIQVRGPGGASQDVSEPRVLRVSLEKLSLVDKEPPWLQGFRSKSTAEAMGSILATVEGRSVPLTIGYHKVSVDIRDQIARTEVEESFANRTDNVLEGVFYFPLPGDASISGFGMWIGDELVEADIVEKERAREIYETILAEKRDPGILEWTGGSLFKARVYPIPANGEKRIRITYTQVLPKEGSVYRYSYALQSEMLRLHPLRELKVDVKIASVEAISSVACPSHLARVRSTPHAAQVEFAAQEYSPARDFEVIVTTEPVAQGVTVIPHVRDGEGYFLALISAPPAPGAVARAEPLDLLLVADTSGSLTDDDLREQRLFIVSLLESLGEKDRFQLLAFDMSASWAFDGPVPSTAENREKALRFLEKRGALGWTDLDLAVSEAVSRVSKSTHVIYVGDGVLTRGDPDPAAFATRIQKLHRGLGSFHSVALGSASDFTILRAIASLGSGSVRQVGDGKDAAQTASELLRELSSGGLRDLRLEWNGIRVARVYPETLPNLPAGRQQIVLGRYLPDAKTTSGALRMTAEAGGKRISVDAAVDLGEASTSNSFIPRLWARLHLDHLLAQGSSSEVKQQIIALSEDYQIITPYTSLLVLESDADRERFRVKRQFRMRGGEEFFAAGRASAEEEIAKQQMLAARSWRQGLREEVLRRYERMSSGESGIAPRRRSTRLASTVSLLTRKLALDDLAAKPGERVLAMGGGADYSDSLFGRTGAFVDDSGRGGLPIAFTDAEEGEPAEEQDAKAELGLGFDGASVAGGRLMSQPHPGSFDGGTGFAIDFDASGRSVVDQLDPEQLASSFPFPDPPDGPFERAWPQEIRDLLAKLDRRDRVARLEGGLRISVETERFDSRGRPEPEERRVSLVSAREWAVQAQARPSEAPYLHWLRAGTRGTLDEAMLLGGTRAAQAGDERSYPVPYASFRGIDGLDPRHFDARLTRDGVKAMLSFKGKTQEFELRYTIDVELGLILEETHVQYGVVQSSATISDPTQALGASWPRKIEWRDGEGKLASSTRITVEALPSEAFGRAMEEALAPLPESILLARPLPRVEAAKRRVRDGSATFADRWVLGGYYALSSRLEPMREQTSAALALVAGKPGAAWLRLEALGRLRRNEEARQVGLELEARTLGSPQPVSYARSLLLLQRSAVSLAPAERLSQLEALRPVFERQDPRTRALKDWGERRAGLLNELGRAEEALMARQALVEAYPDDAGILLAYAEVYVGRLEVDLAIEQVTQALEKGGPWSEPESRQLRERVSTLLFNQRRLVEHLAWIDRWDSGQKSHVTAEELRCYLSSLVLLDREGEADERIRAWIEAGRKPDAGARAHERLEAAVSHALGEGPGVEVSRVDKRWIPLLVDLARSFAFDPRRDSITAEILESYKFRNTDAAAALRQELYRELVKGVSALPGQVLVHLYERTTDYSLEKEDLPRADLLERMLERWSREEDGAARGLLELFLVSNGKPELGLKLRRIQLERAKDDVEKAELEAMIVDLLFQLDWSAETEEKLASLISSSRVPPFQRVEWAARYLTWLVEKRAALELRETPDIAKKSARELRPIRAAALAKAQSAAVEALRKLEGATGSSDVLPFVRIERLVLEARLRLEPARVAAELRSLVLEIPAPKDSVEPGALDEPRGRLANRALLAQAYIATRPDADPSLAAQLLSLLDELIAKRAAAVPVRFDAREHKHWLLVALDRPDELESALAKWAEEDGDIAGTRWRVPLAYILAERSKLRDAVGALREVEKSDELQSPQYRLLAEWLRALGEMDARREALLKAFAAMGEWEILSQLRGDVSRVQRTGEGVPGDLGEETMLRMEALLRKSAQPGSQLSVVQQLYEATKDFRLLEALSEAVLGQTVARIYPLLEALGPLLALVQDEATVDRLVQYLTTRRALTASAVDRRAIQLLAFLVEKRAAAQANGAGPHATAALAAMRQAWKGDWAEGEPVAMARLLASLGELKDPLREEPLRQLQVLHDGAKPGSEDRVMIASSRAKALDANGKRPLAIQVLDAALRERREAAGGLLPFEADAHLHTLSQWLEATGEVREAEKLWREELARPYSELRKRGMALHLYHVYARAIATAASTSIGKGVELYPAARDQILAALGARTVESQAGQLVASLVQLFVAANMKQSTAVAGDVRDFAFQGLPRVLALYNHRGSQPMVVSTSQAVKRILGPKENLAFLVARAENEPAWLASRGSGFWQQSSGLLAQARKEVQELGDLEPRLLALVLQRLRYDLPTGQNTTHAFCQRSSPTFWGQKAEDFYRMAMETLEKEGGSEEIVLRVAEYLREGLGRNAQAIAVLERLEKAGQLHEPGRTQLARWLLEGNRPADAARIVKSLVEAAPDNLEHRALQVKALAGAGDPAAARTALGAAVKYFHEDKRWSEQAASRLGFTCVEARLLEEAVDLLKESIAFRLKARLRGGSSGDGTLSGYYVALSRAFSQLQRTGDAVDAASAAIVTWGRRNESRKQAEEALLKVLADAKDLDAFAAKLEEESARSGLENPTVRKAIGRVYLERKDFARAIRNFEAAIESGPPDPEAQRNLISAFDGSGDPVGASARVLSLARKKPHELPLWRELGDRLAKLERSEESERAYTTLAEMSANESEGHAALGSLRQEQRRFEDALVEWRQVTRIRSREPGGYLGLARALKALNRSGEAREALDFVLRQPWPARFGNVAEEARGILDSK